MPLLGVFLCAPERRAGGNGLTFESFAPTWLAQMSALMTPEQSARLHAQNQGVTQQRMLREMAQALEALTAEAPLVLLI